MVINKNSTDSSLYKVCFLFWYLNTSAAVGGDRDCAHLLIRYGCDINIKDKDGKTALMIAVVNNHHDLVELLIEKDADLSITNEVRQSLCLKQLNYNLGVENMPISLNLICYGELSSFVQSTN